MPEPLIGRYLSRVPRPAVTGAIAAVGFAGSWIVALQRPVARWELRVTDWLNESSDLIAGALYPIMQAGTPAGPLVAAAAIGVWRRDWWLSATTAAVGLFTWVTAKGVKEVVQRDRPPFFLAEIVVRDGDGTGLGFISGHSAVSAATAVMVMAALPRRWRVVPPVVAGLVGVARIVNGVHFPADVIGGWSFGVLIALGALRLLDGAHPPQTDES